MSFEYKPIMQSRVELASRGDSDVEGGQIDQPWDEFARFLTWHDRRVQKDGPCFMPVIMKPVDEWVLSKPRKGGVKPGYRNDENVAAVSMVVLDLDRPGARDLAEKAFRGYEYVIYSTHSHSAQTPYKYRIVLPLSAPIPTEHWKAVFNQLAGQAGADIACSNVSRIFYYPSANPHSGMEPMARHNRGRVLEADQLIARAQASERTMAMIRRSATGEGRRAPAPHFAGADLAPNPMNYRLYALERRHRASIDQIKQDDSRHYFTMTVLAREFARFGARTDLNRLFQFLFYAAEQHSSRGLDTGNTIEELPELVISAWDKFAGADSKLPQAVLMQAIEDAMACAFEAQRDGRWDFTETAVLPATTVVVKVKADDPIICARTVIEEGLKKTGHQVRLADLARATLDNLNPKDPQAMIDKLSEAAARIRPEHGPWSAEQFQRFWRGALVRAAAQRAPAEPAL